MLQLGEVKGQIQREEVNVGWGRGRGGVVITRNFSAGEREAVCYDETFTL